MKWTLSIDAKRTFSEPEEQDEPDTPTIKTVQPDSTDSSDNLKNNPYVEIELVRKDTREALRRSQSIDDVIDTDSRLVDPSLRMPIMYERSRAQSEPDVLSTLGPEGDLSPAASGRSIHGIRLKPLKTKKIEESKTDSGEEPENKRPEELERSETLCSTKSKHAEPQTCSTSQEDRKLVAKALGTSACVDVGIQNRSNKLKVM